MDTISYSFAHNKKKYVVETPIRRQEVGRLLTKFFLNDVAMRVMTVDLDAQSKGGRVISKIDNYVIKKSNNALTEFKKTLQIEEITDITPITGGVLREDGRTEGLIALQFFDGIPPVNMNPFTMKPVHRDRLVKAILFAMGKLHIGNGKTSILHRDGHLGNFIIIPNPNENENLFRNEERLEVRIIDLEKALVTPFSRKILGEMAFDLSITLNQLMYGGFLTASEVIDTLNSYLEANHRLNKKDLIRILKEEIPKHKKLKMVNNLLTLLDDYFNAL
ncbi:MAG: hypothetical protein QXF35_04135 [Candidatus Bilamarchaeaceae archaeon]